MPRRDELARKDLREVLDLVCSLDELMAAGARDEARRVLLASTQRLLGARSVMWSIFDLERSPASAPPPRGAVLLDFGGLDEWQLAATQKPFFEDGAYIEHPLVPELRAMPGRVRAHLRPDLVPDRVWERHPHAAFARMLGFDSNGGGMAPIAPGREVLLGVGREVGEPPLGARERALLGALLGALRWFFRQLAEPLADDAGRLRLEGLRARLAPRLRTIFDALLTGRSEKEIAALAGLSPRTVHKYVEHVYRAAGVSSRLELMARFILPRHGSARM
ncbi:MAG: helix-turn-helix transcriptional regulator [Planctomycetes bacterium]|nr:helix-turn-helix transcriptional regulator [Planctomycetota bacterium]